MKKGARAPHAQQMAWRGTDRGRGRSEAALHSLFRRVPGCHSRSASRGSHLLAFLKASGSEEESFARRVHRQSGAFGATRRGTAAGADEPAAMLQLSKGFLLHDPLPVNSSLPLTISPLFSPCMLLRASSLTFNGGSRPLTYMDAQLRTEKPL